MHRPVTWPSLTWHCEELQTGPVFAASCTFYQYLALTCVVCLPRASISFTFFPDNMSGVHREAVNDVARCLARLDPDYRAAVAEEFIKGTTTIQTSAADNERQELAEAICQAAIEQADPVQLGELLSNQVVDNVTAAEIADILALLAAQRGHASIIPILADNGAQFDRPDFHRGGPPLMHAVNNGHASTVAALLEVVIPCFSVLLPLAGCLRILSLTNPGLHGQCRRMQI